MAFTRKDIVEYYKNSEISFKLVWDLGHSMAIHYGFTDEKAKTFRQSLGRFNEVLAETAHITKNDHVLDAGCGVGGSSIFLASTIGCRARGVTVCPKQARDATRNAIKSGVQGNVSFYEMDYCSTAFKDETFDVVWGLESICYAEDKSRFIQEAYRVLKKGGRLVVADGFAAKESFSGEEDAIMRQYLDGWVVNSIATPEAFVGHAEDAGFINCTFRDVSNNVLPSSKKMFYYSVPAILLAKVQHFFHLITAIEASHSVTLYNQYKALKMGLWKYGVFYGEKK